MPGKTVQETIKRFKTFLNQQNKYYWLLVTVVVSLNTEAWVRSKASACEICNGLLWYSNSFSSHYFGLTFPVFSTNYSLSLFIHIPSIVCNLTICSVVQHNTFRPVLVN